MSDVDPSGETALRSFNRFFTAIMGFLDQGLHQSAHSLTEARVIFELAQHPEVEVSTLRTTLGIDPGQLSRTLATLETAGLVDRSRSTTDGRRQVAALTAAGRDAFATLDSRSDQQAVDLLATLTAEDQRRLTRAFGTIRELLDDKATPSVVVIRPLRTGDLGWVVERNAVLYGREYGWDQTYEDRGRLRSQPRPPS